MKYQFLMLSLFFASMTYAQSGSGFGIKGGLNYNSNGDVTNSAGEVLAHPDGNAGFHLGVFGKLGNTLFIKPELVYTNTKSTYKGNTFNNRDDFKMQKLDLPVLVGYQIIGPLNVFAGPAFQYILNTDFEDVTLGDVQNDFTVGLNFGVGLNLGSLGLDLRYERGFTKNEANFIDSNIVDLNNGRIDTRPEQVILSLSVKL